MRKLYFSTFPPSRRRGGATYGPAPEGELYRTRVCLCSFAVAFFQSLEGWRPGGIPDGAQIASHGPLAARLPEPRKKEKIANLKKELPVRLTTDFKEAVADADQVLLCVSINALEEVAKTISPALHRGQVVMDICSIKEAPVQVMHENIKGALVLGTHPVFGPGSNGVKHKAYVLTPTNAEEEKFAAEFKNVARTRRSACLCHVSEKA